MPEALITPKCRVCGCTDADCSRCVAITGQPCSWVEDDLCSACATAKDAASPAATPPASTLAELLQHLADNAGEAAAVLGQLAEATEPSSKVPATRTGIVLAGANDLIGRLADEVPMMNRAGAMQLGAIIVHIAANGAELAALCFQRVHDIEVGAVESPSPIATPATPTLVLVDPSGRPIEATRG